MTRHTLLTLATVFVLGMSGAVLGVHSASRDDAPTLTRTVVLDGLDDPWDLAFTPDGAMLFKGSGQNDVKMHAKAESQ